MPKCPAHIHSGVHLQSQGRAGPDRSFLLSPSARWTTCTTLSCDCLLIHGPVCLLTQGTESLARWTCHVALSPVPGTDDSDYRVDEQTNKQAACIPEHRGSGSLSYSRVKGTARGNPQAASDPRPLLARLQLVSPTRHLGTQRTGPWGDSGGPVHPSCSADGVGDIEAI